MNPTYHVAIPILLALAMNGWIYARHNPKRKSSFAPAFAVIWTVLFGFMGYTHYLLHGSVASWAVVGLVGFCLAYPLIRLRVKTDLNLVALFLSFAVSVLVIRESVYAFYWLVPLLAWTIFVNVFNREITKGDQ